MKKRPVSPFDFYCKKTSVCFDKDVRSFSIKRAFVWMETCVRFLFLGSTRACANYIWSSILTFWCWMLWFVRFYSTVYQIFVNLFRRKFQKSFEECLPVPQKSVPLHPLSRGKRVKEMKFWWQGVSRSIPWVSCTEYLTLHAARERERVSLDGNATTRIAAESFSKKLSEKFGGSGNPP